MLNLKCVGWEGQAVLWKHEVEDGGSVCVHIFDEVGYGGAEFPHGDTILYAT